MQRSQAISIVDEIKNVDSALMKLEPYFDSLEDAERRTFREALATVIGAIYEHIEIPIYRRFPDLPNRRDQ